MARVLIWMEVLCWSVSVMAENKTRQLLRGRDLFQLTVSQVTDGLTWSMALGWWGTGHHGNVCQRLVYFVVAQEQNRVRGGRLHSE